MDFIFLSPGKSDFRILEFRVEELPFRFWKFKHSKRDVPIYRVEKRDETTWELLERISEDAGIPLRKIGYAGLKDKRDVTVQYISLPKEVDLPYLEHVGYFKTKLKPGMLNGNRFTIRIEGRIDKRTTEFLEENRIYNYFGLQRFGATGKNHLLGAKVIKSGKKRLSEREKFLVHSLQSFVFNQSINLLHPNVPEDLSLPGREICDDTARDILRKFGIEPEEMPVRGEWRKAWLKVEGLEAGKLISFTLPPGSYGTIVLQEYLKRPVRLDKGRG